MEDRDIEPVLSALERRQEATPCDLHRALYAEVDVEIGLGNETPLWLFGFLC